MSSAINGGPPDHLLRNRNFVLLWSAYAISALGDHLSEIAILKSLNAIDRDVDVTGLSARMSFMFFLPFFLLSPVTGTLADRLPRRGLMITADLMRCLIMFNFGLLMALTHGWGTWGPFVPLAAVGAFAALFSPARSALLPTLIRPDQLVRANGMISGMGIIATMAANQVGGYIAQHHAPEMAFRIDAATFLASALCLFVLRVPASDTPTVRHTSTRTIEEVLSGYRYVRAHRRVLELIAVMALVWFCGALVNSGLPALVRDTYGGNYQTISSYRALIGLGFLLGAIGMTTLGDALKSEIAISWGLLGVSIGIFLLTASAFLPLDRSMASRVGGVGIVIAGFFAVSAMAGTSALLQRVTANRFRGRVFGVNDLGSIGALLLATGVLGIPRQSRLDPYVAHIFAGVAVLTALAGVVTLMVRLRRGLHPPFLTFGENLNEFICKFWWRFRRIGRSTVPRSGPVIIAANHTCAPDPLFICAGATYRIIAFMIAQEFARWPIVRFFVRLIGCIPVTRAGQDTAAFKQSLRHLESGRALCVFIEGRIMKPGETPKLRDGVALLARQTGATVIPAFISGTTYRESVIQGLFLRHRARVRFGKPVELSDLFGDSDAEKDRELLRSATERIYAAILALDSDPDPSQVGKTGNSVSKNTR